eukprot:TRINITY_DN5271_c0_g1_i1.p1 TRINITY_DN5271_c0_g1~~TRINITY_DN5271_c0_g1_i1.p1  ORF type:complete len:614 (-),score=216.77 TRINITY_DN5271_c0_g1_i1:145-1986(-)
MPAPAAGASVIPFPRGAVPGWGALHTLCSLQCEVRDPTSFAVNGIRIDRADSVCHSPVDVRSVPGLIGDTVYADELALGARVRRVAARATLPASTLVTDVAYDRAFEPAVSCNGGDAGRITAEGAIVTALTLTRNTLAGALTRVNGKFEVLAVSRLTLGLCVDTLCSAVVAVETTLPGAIVPCNVSAEALGCSVGGTPLLWYAGVDGVERPVSAGRVDLLSLGRGVLSRADGFGRAAAAALNVSAAAVVLNEQATLVDEPPPALAGTRHWLDGRGPATLHDGSAMPTPTSGGTAWADALVWILCAGRRVFVRDASLCDGVAPFLPAQQLVVGNRRGDLPALFKADRSASLTTTWAIDPSVRLLSAAPADAPLFAPTEAVNATETAKDGPRAAWLDARGAREINPESAEERALAAALRRRTALLPLPPTSGLSSGISAAIAMLQPSLNALHADAVRLSATYDQSVWGVDEPEQPVNVATVVLAAVVVVAEIGVLASIFAGTSVWDWKALRALAITAGAGLFALAAFVSQYVLERRNEAWRAVATRDALLVQVTGVGARVAPLNDYRGTLVVRTQSLLVAARNGYAPTRLLWFMVGASVGYVLVAVGLFVWVWQH